MQKDTRNYLRNTNAVIHQSGKSHAVVPNVFELQAANIGKCCQSSQELKKTSKQIHPKVALFKKRKKTN